MVRKPTRNDYFDGYFEPFYWYDKLPHSLSISKYGYPNCQLPEVNKSAVGSESLCDIIYKQYGICLSLFKYKRTLQT